MNAIERASRSISHAVAKVSDTADNSAGARWSFDAGNLDGCTHNLEYLIMNAHLSIIYAERALAEVYKLKGSQS